MAKMINLITRGDITTVKDGNKIIGKVIRKSATLFEAYMRDGKYIGNNSTMQDSARAINRVRHESHVIDNSKLMPILNDMNLLTSLENLASRWVNESQYEDWNDYAKIITDKFAAHGAEVKRTTKRPFGAVVAIDGMDDIKIFLKYRGNTVRLATATL